MLLVVAANGGNSLGKRIWGGGDAGLGWAEGTRRNRGGVSTNPAFCLSSTPAGRGHCNMSHHNWDTFGEQGGSPVTVGMDVEAGVGKESNPARKDWEAAWKNRVSAQQPRGKKQRDPVHLRNERVVWVVAMHKIHQSSSAENKPLGNTPFLLELAKRVWGCVHVYKPFYINCKYCCLRYVHSCLGGGEILWRFRSLLMFWARSPGKAQTHLCRAQASQALGTSGGEQGT